MRVCLSLSLCLPASLSLCHRLSGTSPLPLLSETRFSSEEAERPVPRAGSARGQGVRITKGAQGGITERGKRGHA